MKHIKLKNGIKAFLVPVEGTQATTVLVMAKVGSRYETPEINGASHFIEHMMFKGTRRRPTAQHISRTLDGIGADYNAFTGKSYTGYYVKVDKSHLELGIDLIDDMLFSSKMDPKELDRERGAIVEEIHMYEDNPMMHVSDLLEQEMFTGSSLGWEIAGTPKIIKEIDRDEMHAFYKKYYQPSNMLLVVAGNVDRRARGWIESRFGRRKDAREAPGGFETLELPLANKRPRARVQTKKTQQIQLAMGFPGYGYQDPRNPAVSLLANILGGTMSSRLFTEVRERKGLAYFVRAAHSSYEDTGVFMIRAGLDKTRLELAMKTIRKEVRKIKRENVSAKELKQAKANVRGQMAIRLEDSFQRAQWFASEMMFQRRIRTPKTYLKRVEEVRPQDIKAAANDILNEKVLSLAAVGPFKDSGALLNASGFKAK